MMPMTAPHSLWMSTRDKRLRMNSPTDLQSPLMMLALYSSPWSMTHAIGYAPQRASNESGNCEADQPLFEAILNSCLKYSRC